MGAIATEPPTFENFLSRSVDIAARAPSSHNSQPWAVARLSSRASRDAVARLFPDAPTAADWFALAIDAEREIRALPDLHVEMIASCGMFFDALVRVLREEGFRCEVSWVGDARSPIAIPGWPSKWRGIAVVSATRREDSVDDTKKDAARLLERRHTNRGPYERNGVSRDVLGRIAGARPSFTSAKRGGARLVMVEDRQTIERAARFVRRYGARDLVHEGAWRETYSFIRFSEREARARDDGFDVAQLFGPLGPLRRSFLRVALAPSVMQALRWTPYPSTIARGLGDRITTSAALLCVTVRDPNPNAGDVFEAGGLAMDAWLRATESGLAVHPVSVALQHEDLRVAFERELGLDDRLLFFARLGRPKNAQMSTVGMTARRPIFIKTL